MRRFVLAALMTSCAGPSDEEVLRDNGTPHAWLRAPVIAPLDEVVWFDASESLDPDGDPLTFIFQFNDSTETQRTSDPRAGHIFSQEGIYTVLVWAIDVHGAEGLAAQDVSIRGDYPTTPSFCDELRPCVVGDECEAGVCYTSGGTLE